MIRFEFLFDGTRLQLATGEILVFLFEKNEGEDACLRVAYTKQLCTFDSATNYAYAHRPE